MNKHLNTDEILLKTDIFTRVRVLSSSRFESFSSLEHVNTEVILFEQSWRSSHLIPSVFSAKRAAWVLPRCTASTILMDTRVADILDSASRADVRGRLMSNKHYICVESI
ncbi:PREDICTED: uncharacterized protein LOC108747983 [Trachymyrmex septentrionalis]|uniref:uncharacterized protein LOC108747983 n=1 Tax=Trachymyrmex septentrionalis TaxID=34720 RepID=UPI00084F28EF|nr:PREDICTED: uncharacterized protein LOC108747983 [Trachymyrmex septentrionalis]